MRAVPSNACVRNQLHFYVNMASPHLSEQDRLIAMVLGQPVAPKPNIDKAADCLCSCSLCPLDGTTQTQEVRDLQNRTAC